MQRLVPPLLLSLFLCLVAAPAFAAKLAATNVPTVIISDEPGSDQFDKDFADEFNDDFDGDYGREELIADPFEGFNREMFWVNDKLYFYLMKPVARGYRTVVPQPARISVGNFFSNLATPVRAVNALLQFKVGVFVDELYRFIVNTTFGLAGLFDPAGSAAGVKKHEEDFGQTMGYYGAGHGFYLFLPLIGPSSLRDASGSLVDMTLDPFWYADLRNAEYLGIKVGKSTNDLSLDKDTYEGIIRDAIDPYLFIRAAYAQQRTAQVEK